MFDELDGLAGLGDAELVAAMGDGLRVERQATARRLIAAGLLCQRRIAESGADEAQWCIDNWEAVAAEVAAELGVSRGRASKQMEYGKNLIERMPALARVCLRGQVDYRIIMAIDFRTGLITDPEVLAALDARLAAAAPRWNRLSRDRIAELVDWMVLELDAEALRISAQREADWSIEVHPGRGGMAELSGTVSGVVGAVFDQRLDELAATVCPDDPRTKQQRRADAVGPLSDRMTVLPCQCGSENCPAGAAPAPAASSATSTVIHVIAQQATVTGDSDQPGYLPGVGAVPAAAVSALSATARVKPLPHPKDLCAEPAYRPSAALADFIRCRDLCCRWPGCDVPASRCDIDHTRPYPTGPTHPSNCKLYCRAHHLLKTFFSGPDGWREWQLPDGTMEFISPAGRRYTTKPHGALFFPQLAVPTATLTLADGSPTGRGSRTLAMPTRRRTREQDRAYRIAWERNRNKRRWAADPPPF